MGETIPEWYWNPFSKVKGSEVQKCTSSLVEVSGGVETHGL